MSEFDGARVWLSRAATKPMEPLAAEVRVFDADLVRVLWKRAAGGQVRAD